MRIHNGLWHLQAGFAFKSTNPSGPFQASGNSAFSVSMAQKWLPPRLSEGDDDLVEEAEPAKRRRMPFPIPFKFGSEIAPTISMDRTSRLEMLAIRMRKKKTALPEVVEPFDVRKILGKEIEIPDFLKGALRLIGRRK